MRYRRNSDEKLRGLQRKFQTSGTLPDLLALNTELLRTGQPLDASMPHFVPDLLRERTRDFKTAVVSYDTVYTFDNPTQYEHNLQQYGDDPNYEVVHELLGYDVKKNILSDPSPEELEEEFANISYHCNLLGWPTFYSKFKLDFPDYYKKDQIADFLGCRDKDLDTLTSHEEIASKFTPTNLEAIFERPLDDYELEEAARYEVNLHKAFDRSRLARHLYIANPELLAPTGILREPPNGFILLADHIGKYETYLHYCLCQQPSKNISYEYEPKYVTWMYNIQSGGYSSGNYFTDFNEAQEDYLRRIFRV